jgi:hypothetical protein
LVGLLASVLLFLYVLLFGGQWFLFFWAAGLSLTLLIAIKLLTLSVLDDKRQLDVSAMLSELLGGVFSFTWMVLVGASFVLFFKALIFGGHWLDFFTCLFAVAVCKFLAWYAIWTHRAALFKSGLVGKGLTEAQARRVWIAKGRAIIQQSEPPS